MHQNIKKRPYKFTILAETQLDDVIYYIALDNPTAALRVYKKVIETCEMICDMPNIGRRSSYVTDPDIFYINVNKYNNYQIYYKVNNDHILILMVHHGARDFPNILS